MSKISFSNEKTQAIFNTDCTFAAFSDLMKDVALKKAIYDAEGNEVSADEANKKIRSIMFQVLGLDEDANRKELRRAIRRHKTDVFEVIEDTEEKNEALSKSLQDYLRNESVTIVDLNSSSMIIVSNRSIIDILALTYQGNKTFIDYEQEIKSIKKINNENAINCG